MIYIWWRGFSYTPNASGKQLWSFKDSTDVKMDVGECIESESVKIKARNITANKASPNHFQTPFV